MCGQCQSMEWDSIESTLDGEILSYTALRHPKIPGYPTDPICAVIKLSEGTNIVSNVVGEIAPGEDALSALLAGLPAGTVSGAPKVRAMEIIDELEPTKRGIYAGAVGYLGFNGDMDLAIAIRTAVIKDGRIYVQAGAGIVADSDPDAEWEETRNKARAQLRAAEMAESGLDTRFE